jgi:hypothetical protein
MRQELPFTLAAIISKERAYPRPLLSGRGSRTLRPGQPAALSYKLITARFYYRSKRSINRVLGVLQGSARRVSLSQGLRRGSGVWPTQLAIGSAERVEKVEIGNVAHVSVFKRHSQKALLIAALRPW